MIFGLAVTLFVIGFLTPMEFNHFLLEPERDYSRTFFLLALSLEMMIFFLKILILYGLFMGTGLGLLLGITIGSPRNYFLIKKPYKLWKKVTVSLCLYSLLIIVSATTNLVMGYVMLFIASVYTARFVSTETYCYLERKKAELKSPPIKLAA